jgi:hypothetical protein
MNDFNPYAAPVTDLSTPRAAGEVWRDGVLLVMSKDSELPDRCLKCNEAADGWRIKRKLSWHPPAYYFLILLHILIYVIVALIVRNTATVFVPLCPQHRRRRRRFIALAWVLCLGGIASLVGGITGASSSLPNAVPPFLYLGGLVTFIAGLVFAILASQVAVPKKIDKQFVWLKRVSPELLAGLPSWRT